MKIEGTINQTTNIWQTEMMRGTSDDGRTLFSQEHYEAIIKAYKKRGYAFLTLHEYVIDRGSHHHKVVLLRHDVDKMFSRLTLFADVESTLGVKATYFIRLHADYNPFDYSKYGTLKHLLRAGHEVGLHSNFVQFAKIHGEDPIEVLRREVLCLRSILEQHFPGMAPHRDVNFVHNSIDLCTPKVLEEVGLKYHAYQNDFFHDDEIMYVNEGGQRFLDWCQIRPDFPLLKNKSAYILTHPHWWFRLFPDE